MERRQRDVWLIMQGYHRHKLRPKITWYGYQGREFQGQSDDYTIDLYRGKGFVLDRKFLDPDQWQHLEYVIAEKPTEQFPCLADSVIGFMKELPTWEGTATELIELMCFAFGNTFNVWFM